MKLHNRKVPFLFFMASSNFAVIFFIVYMSLPIHSTSILYTFIKNIDIQTTVDKHDDIKKVTVYYKYLEIYCSDKPNSVDVYPLFSGYYKVFMDYWDIRRPEQSQRILVLLPEEDEAKHAELDISCQYVGKGMWKITFRKKLLLLPGVTGDYNLKSRFKWNDGPIMAYWRESSSQITKLRYEDGRFFPIAMTALKDYNN